MPQNCWELSCIEDWCWVFYHIFSTWNKIFQIRNWLSLNKIVTFLTKNASQPCVAVLVFIHATSKFETSLSGWSHFDHTSGNWEWTTLVCKLNSMSNNNRTLPKDKSLPTKEKWFHFNLIVSWWITVAHRSIIVTEQCLVVRVVKHDFNLFSIWKQGLWVQA